MNLQVLKQLSSEQIEVEIRLAQPSGAFDGPESELDKNVELCR